MCGMQSAIATKNVKIFGCKDGVGRCLMAEECERAGSVKGDIWAELRVRR